MSAAEHQSPDVSSQASDPSLNAPPQRPSLRQPPLRPEPAPAQPTPSKPELPARSAITAAPPTPQTQTPATEPAPTPLPNPNHPIAPPSEPMQYRAIGLVKGTYQPSEEQLNRGNILSDDGAVIDSVLLGRVTSLIKKHIDLESSHLWVVYPRTRQALEDSDETGSEGGLHLQIVGVWEPETLGLPGENPNTKGAAAKTDAADADETDDADENTAPEVVTADLAESESALDETASENVAVDEPSENYFSIRGEVLSYDEDDQKILVKIVQGSKRSGKPPKAFKLNVFGEMTGKTVGYFWEMDVERQSEKLVMVDGHAIRMVPPKKKKKGKSFGPRRDRRPGMSDKPRPSRSSEKPRIRPSAPVKSNPL
ncbi:MAG: hypothetical protein AAFR26_15690 [Cyanobacteria bacterium J06626_4]